jgi:PAS domain S-box-containing protein
MRSRAADESEDQTAELLAAEELLGTLAGVFFPAGAAASTPPRDADALAVEDRYRILVEQIPAVVFMVYLDRGIGEAYVSPQIEAILGFTQEEWLNDPVRWYAQIHPEDKTRWSVEAAELFLTGQPLKSDYRVLSRDGRVVWFHCEATMVRGEDGRPWFIHGVGFDVTEIKRAEEAVRDSEQMLRGLFESAPDTVVVVNRDGCIERVNAQVERMFGFTPDELRGQPVEVLMPDRYRQRHGLVRAAYQIEPHRRPMGAGLELYSRRKDGSEVPVDIMLSPMETPDGGMVIAVVRDVTNRKRAEESLKRREEELRALTASLLAVQDEERRRIARELHDGTAQNLAALAMNLSLLMSAPGTLPEANVQRILSDTLGLAEQCSNEVRNLSYLLHPPLLDDLGLVSALKSYIAGFSQRTQVHVDLEIPADFGRLTQELETAIFRIVQEGLANIHRHSGASRAAIRLILADAVVKLIVRDEGEGVRDAETVRPGVGIPGMRERAQQLGGRMELHSTSSGTTVTVTLPLRSAP